MYRRLQLANVPLPETRFLDEKAVTTADAAALFEQLGTPLVLKAPNSSFSAYVDKATTPEEFVRVGKRFLRRADRIVVQQYLPSAFDWRVITLHGKVLAVVEYRFAADRWKVMQRGGEGESAVTRGIPRDEAPGQAARRGARGLERDLEQPPRRRPQGDRRRVLRHRGERQPDDRGDRRGPGEPRDLHRGRALPGRGALGPRSPRRLSAPPPLGAPTTTIARWRARP
jgi:hypothetical protein